MSDDEVREWEEEDGPEGSGSERRRGMPAAAVPGCCPLSAPRPPRPPLIVVSAAAAAAAAAPPVPVGTCTLSLYLSLSSTNSAMVGRMGMIGFGPHMGRNVFLLSWSLSIPFMLVISGTAISKSMP